MLVYIYNKRTNEKVETIKNVEGILSKETTFKIKTADGFKEVEKKNIKLVVYGF